MARLFLRQSHEHEERDIEAVFGRLEMGVLETLWRRGSEASVRDVHEEFPNTAYTTLMTTLDRLHRKGVLDRVKSGRAFLYTPRYSRDGLRVWLAGNAIDVLLGSRRVTRPLLSFLVDAVSRGDEALLDELEQLVCEKRRERERTSEGDAEPDASSRGPSNGARGRR
jgi:predicted transcriptional regulator